MELKKMIIPSLIGGLGSGFVAALPVINCCNVCCLWVILGGMGAAYLYHREATIQMADGAVVGAFTGIPYAFLTTILYLAIKMLIDVFGITSEYVKFRDPTALFGDVVFAGLNTLVFAVIMFFGHLILGMIFGALGGVIAALIIERKK
ncbi:MAG: hypothetical protein GF334_10630 [Candidatus Altiarchaeales archaeon]|nr:hypothetical protein [Candidatus Altiarchaeales archaeon]